MVQNEGLEASSLRPSENFGRALRTSVRAYQANRVMSLRWGLRVAILLVIGSIPLFLGLAVVLPVLGYATWHLYTRLVDRSALEPAIRHG